MRVLESIESGFPRHEAWDELVARDPRGHLLQTWAWGELKRAFGWIPVRLAVERDGVLLAGAQVLYRRLGPFSLGYIPKGPVVAREESQQTDSLRALNALWKAIHSRSRRMRAISLKVEPEWYEEETSRVDRLVAQGLRPSKECIQPRRTIIVDLRPDEEQLLARMKSKWRYNIRLSARKGVIVREGTTEDMATFYDLMRITGERNGFGIHTRDYYRRALELFAPSGRSILYMAYYENLPLAGLIAYAFNGQSWYMYGASSNEHRELMPNHQLQWRAMQWAKSKGSTQYDLWGIPDTEADSVTASLAGLQRFKEGFGGKVVRYVGAYDYVYSSPLYWMMRKAWNRRRDRELDMRGDRPDVPRAIVPVDTPCKAVT